jgi:predicted nucleotidyltransferase
MTTPSEALSHPALNRFVEDLKRAAGRHLVSVVLYGSAARGDYTSGTSDLNVLVVLDELEPRTLERLTAPIQRWLRSGQPPPRLLSPGLMADSADVFPIEFLDLKASRVVLFGADPVSHLEVRTGHLRLQCERELREKLMRLREAYTDVHAHPRRLRRLLTESYPTFVAVFRGCLRLVGEEPPRHNTEVVATFCARADLDRLPFEKVARLKAGEPVDLDPKTLFATYHEELTKAVRRVDRFESRSGADSLLPRIGGEG